MSWVSFLCILFVSFQLRAAEPYLDYEHEYVSKKGLYAHYGFCAVQCAQKHGSAGDVPGEFLLQTIDYPVELQKLLKDTLGYSALEIIHRYSYTPRKGYELYANDEVLALHKHLCIRKTLPKRLLLTNMSTGQSSILSEKAHTLNCVAMHNDYVTFGYSNGSLSLHTHERSHLVKAGNADNQIAAVAFSDDYIVSADNNGVTEMLIGSYFNIRMTLPHIHKNIYALALHKNTLCSAIESGIILRDLRTSALLDVVATEVCPLSLYVDDEKILAGTEEGSVLWFDIRNTHKPVHTLSGAHPNQRDYSLSRVTAVSAHNNTITSASQGLLAHWSPCFNLQQEREDISFMELAILHAVLNKESE